jgi:rhodanese-related sulfurtransferase
MMIKSTSANELAARLASDPTLELIDVRTPSEFQSVHVFGAKSFPLETLDPKTFLSGRSSDSGDPLYLICGSGVRSRKACEAFYKAGYEEVVNVEGGTQACLKQGLRVVRGKATISLERQVRIAAGSIVLLATIAGVLLHPLFLGLAGFVGAGLIFAGITDTCGMGMVLTKMPWNQSADGSAKIS